MHAAAQNGDELSFEALLKAGADVSQLGRSVIMVVVVAVVLLPLLLNIKLAEMLSTILTINMHVDDQRQQHQHHQFLLS